MHCWNNLHEWKMSSNGMASCLLKKRLDGRDSDLGLLFWWTLKMKVVKSFKMSGINNPATQQHNNTVSTASSMSTVQKHQLSYRRWQWCHFLPCTNFRICSYCSFACPSFTRSILFCRIRMCFSFIISIAAKCSDVWGCGHDSLPAANTNTSSKCYSFQSQNFCTSDI